MKYKLLSASTNAEVNIGDYIQALSSAQFLPSIDGFIQRELLSSYNGGEAAMIMNGWYMHHPENWPPPSTIKPLFVAFHINSSAKNALLRNESIEYLKKYEPIGCRDRETMRLLKQKGVDAYFSGCMTLTLGEKYKNPVKEDKCYFVDPYFITNWTLGNIIKNGIYLALHWKSISIIARKYPENKSLLRKKMILTAFYREYSKLFTKDTLINAEYINQQSVAIKQRHATEESYLKESEALVKKYAAAKLVVTSRIHCALPCLGLETPVIYTKNSSQSEESACRFDGLEELFTVLTWDKGKLYPKFAMNGKISINNPPLNKLNWKPLATDLIKRAKSFLEHI